ncbi:MAG: carboxylesterase family protein [Leeuwenhoekiella sp.]
MKRIACCIILISALNACKSPENDQKSVDNEPKVTVANGEIEGTYDSDTGLNMYFGIPYAKPPVGNLRWKAPQPAENWEGVKETKEFGNRPVQVKLWDDLIYRSKAMSEDCLYLNVWAPATEKPESLPVLVYIYGGGFMAGDGSELRYDGASLAQKGMVVVTLNYRLNIFGFMVHPELSAESPEHASGNYGLLDQVAALKWVKNNIASFGGNPDKITIGGESAGSISVSSLMVSPLSRDLIAGAIGESGAAINPTLAPVPLADAEAAGTDFVEKTGKKSFAELRALSTEDLFESYKSVQNTRFPTVLDGYFYPKTVTEIFNAGEQAKVPVLLGWNSAETGAGSFMQGKEATEKNFVARVKDAYSNDSKKVLELYAHSTPEEVDSSATALASDSFIAFSTWKWFDLARKNSDAAVYRYMFSKIRPGLKADTTNQASPLGAPHASEIEYALGNLDYIEAREWTDDDHKVSETIEDYFANFIKTGNPNGEGLPQWPAANANDDEPEVMIINTESKAVKATHDDRYRFLDGFYSSDK